MEVADTDMEVVVIGTDTVVVVMDTNIVVAMDMEVVAMDMVVEAMGTYKHMEKVIINTDMTLAVANMKKFVKMNILRKLTRTTTIMKKLNSTTKKLRSPMKVTARMIMMVVVFMRTVVKLHIPDPKI